MKSLALSMALSLGSDFYILGSVGQIFRQSNSQIEYTISESCEDAKGNLASFDFRYRKIGDKEILFTGEFDVEGYSKFSDLSQLELQLGSNKRLGCVSDNGGLITDSTSLK